MSDNKRERKNYYNWLAVLSLVVALFGGIPGFIGVLKYFNRSSIIIKFDQRESLGCIIVNSPNSALNGKFALLLYGVTIVGRGDQKFITYDVSVYIKGNGKWYKGVRFNPVWQELKEEKARYSKAIRILVGPPKVKREIPTNYTHKIILVHDTINICEWNDFEPGISVGFGEPKTFMIAVYFPKAPTNLDIYDKLKILVRDYIGNTYSYTSDISGIKRPPYVLYLDQSVARKK